MAEKRSEESELIVADIPEGQKPLVSVEYPGIVENDDRAIASLGGIDAISKAFYHKNHHLEVRFRPEDTYCKPAIARATKVTNLVLRVRRREKRDEPMECGEGGSQQGWEYSAEVLGLVDTNFEFSGMADFQVLPPGLNNVPHNHQPVDPELFQITEPVDELFASQDVPSFLPPQIFSKFDKPINYNFRPDPKPRVTEKKQTSQLMTDKLRLRRQNNAYAIPFDYKGSIPTQPHPEASLSNHHKLKQLQQLFEERPVWSRLGIQSHLKLPAHLMRSLLVLVGYYFTSGPWKKLWVKFGYDPRSDPSSKKYQCLDFRLPKDVGTAGLEETARSLSDDSLKLAEERFGSEDMESVTAGDETPHVFHPDKLPGQRQLFYQLCDIRDDSLQQVIHSNDGLEVECDETNGWCDENTYEKLRKALSEMTKKTAGKVKAQKLGAAGP